MLSLPRSHSDEIIAHAREDAPNECCGIIAGNDGSATKLYRALNAEASPYRYNVAPKDLLRIYRDIAGNGWDVPAIYPPPTPTQAYPSPTRDKPATWPPPLAVTAPPQAHPAPLGTINNPFTHYVVVLGKTLALGIVLALLESGVHHGGVGDFRYPCVRLTLTMNDIAIYNIT